MRPVGVMSLKDHQRWPSVILCIALRTETVLTPCLLVRSPRRSSKNGHHQDDHCLGVYPPICWCITIWYIYTHYIYTYTVHTLHVLYIILYIYNLESSFSLFKKKSKIGYTPLLACFNPKLSVSTVPIQKFRVLASDPEIYTSKSTGSSSIHINLRLKKGDHREGIVFFKHFARHTPESYS